MMPVLFTIGPYNVYAFGVFLAFSFLFSTFVLWQYAREEFHEEEYLDAFLATCVAALVAARAVYILLHREEFGFNLLMYVLVRQAPGLSLVGGLFGGLIFFWSYAKKRKLNRAHLLDILSIAACLGLVFAKIGQQLGGAGYGRQTEGWIAVRIAGLPGRYHPVELYEALAFLATYVFLRWFYRKAQRPKWPKGLVAGVFGIATLLSVFVLEFFRGSAVYLYGLSIRQIAILVGMAFLIFPLWRKLRAIRLLQSNQ